ncbi:hypothetical protein QTO34_014163 [Cnephaeus nilssonii]|uniref:Uncharacterized protein n=1 Tax=Cnephaeus nilssonii TaxID=3371016 RepID=A0AA40LCV4_CNENI|nr:hypothetical protein QTO34_014163 [Eptesicus nilssonii]
MNVEHVAIVFSQEESGLLDEPQRLRSVLRCDAGSVCICIICSQTMGSAHFPHCRFKCAVAAMVEVVIKNVVELSKQLDLEVEAEDVTELLASHGEELSAEDLTQLKQQFIEEEDTPAPEPRRFTSKELAGPLP